MASAQTRAYRTFFLFNHTTAVESELPCPATKLIIGQHLWIHPSRRSWAWLILASFYDSEGRELWHIEHFLGCSDITISETARALTSNPAEATRDFSYNRPSFHTNHTSHIQTYQPAMATEAFGDGWNPQFGGDPSSRRPAGNAMPSGFTYAVNGMPYGYAGVGTVPGPNNLTPSYVIPQNGYNHPVPVFPGQVPRLPNPHPVVSFDAPAMNLTNSTGGVGCEPGYNYFFPPEHTKLHVIKSSTAPWRLPEGMSMHFGAYHVPVCTTLGEVMAGFGACNPVPKKNKVTEIIQGGAGKWYRGITFSGGDSAAKKSLRDLGWDRSRSGRPGEKPVIWLWITKD
ncbi:hypothetical protein F4677DRAFT_457586 [Hypoxylon crocopeplum]|nr:hypothetical protein F4677DRAFT_457586 [Hypoxylon crocopeplum]